MMIQRTVICHGQFNRRLLLIICNKSQSEKKKIDNDDDDDDGDDDSKESHLPWPVTKYYSWSSIINPWREDNDNINDYGDDSSAMAVTENCNWSSVINVLYSERKRYFSNYFCSSVINLCFFREEKLFFLAPQELIEWSGSKEWREHITHKSGGKRWKKRMKKGAQKKIFGQSKRLTEKNTSSAFLKHTDCWYSQWKTNICSI